MPQLITTLTPRLGEELEISDWLLVDQARIDAFAACTEDMQWIHVDQARAAAGPFGGTIAHGFLTLSLLPKLTVGAWLREAGIKATLNYGLDRVRFLTPVPAGARIRLRLRLASAEQKEPGRVLIALDNTVEIELACEILPKPALIARTLVLAIG